ncbi:unnamed protein product [Cyprideis torosa]|uniref:Uncharacterized protein n=1 Tax=Cyprideis torosa TaxID=163714 RepID=A0A7R8WB27_9CRUS|nr:unnamed protein product [Cyprideis torosa]CAG0891788.1 unnamed protein product [Cyprideis torosa]
MFAGFVVFAVVLGSAWSQAGNEPIQAVNYDEFFTYLYNGARGSVFIDVGRCEGNLVTETSDQLVIGVFEVSVLALPEFNAETATIRSYQMLLDRTVIYELSLNHGSNVTVTQVSADLRTHEVTNWRQLTCGMDDGSMALWVFESEEEAEELQTFQDIRDAFLQGRSLHIRSNGLACGVEDFGQETKIWFPTEGHHWTADNGAAERISFRWLSLGYRQRGPATMSPVWQKTEVEVTSDGMASVKRSAVGTGDGVEIERIETSCPIDPSFGISFRIRPASVGDLPIVYPTFEEMLSLFFEGKDGTLKYDTQDCIYQGLGENPLNGRNYTAEIQISGGVWRPTGGETGRRIEWMNNFQLVDGRDLGLVGSAMFLQENIRLADEGVGYLHLIWLNPRTGDLEAWFYACPLDTAVLMTSTQHYDLTYLNSPEEYFTAAALGKTTSFRITLYECVDSGGNTAPTEYRVFHFKDYSFDVTLQTMKAHAWNVESNSATGSLTVSMSLVSVDAEGNIVLEVSTVKWNDWTPVQETLTYACPFSAATIMI